MALQTPLSRTPLHCLIHSVEVQLSSSLLGLSYSDIDMKVTDKKVVHSKLKRILFDAAYHFMAAVIIKSLYFCKTDLYSITVAWKV